MTDQQASSLATLFSIATVLFIVTQVEIIALFILVMTIIKKTKDGDDKLGVDIGDDAVIAIYGTLRQEEKPDNPVVKQPSLGPLPPVPEGYERNYIQCNKCGRVYYYNFVPYSLSTPICTLNCGHDFKHDTVSITEADFMSKRVK
jgi:hypothetical protein